MLYYPLSIITGALIAAMVAINGELTAAYGVYTATVIIHVIGLAFIALACAIRREQPFRHKGLPAWLYLGGVIGVATTVFNNLSFGRVSLSAIVALGLLGQAVTSLLIDQFGWMGMPKLAFRKMKLIGLFCVLLGTLYMLKGTQFDAIPIIVSFLAGVCVVAARTVNARLAAKSSDVVSVFMNYLIGLAASLAALLALGLSELATQPSGALPVWMYTGGLIGVAIVFLFNRTVARIPAFYMTMLLFVGQVFAGIGIDALTTGMFSRVNAIGGALVAIGMACNVWIDASRSGRAP